MILLPMTGMTIFLVPMRSTRWARVSDDHGWRPPCFRVCFWSTVAWMQIASITCVALPEVEAVSTAATGNASMTACSHIPRRAKERSVTIRLGRPGLSSAGPCRSMMAVESSASYCRASPSQPGDCIMPRLHFGAFLAPHHPIGEHPMLQFRRDLEFVEHLDKLGYDEFWCGEHHSSGWEMIASPEMFLAAAGERSTRIKLATGVVSLPYHHPFHVAQRMVQLDHMTGGRAIFGSGPGALASDAHTLGVDPMLLRDRQDEAIGIIRRLMRGERVTAKADWFMLQDAALQLLPLQEDLPCAVASQISPSGMTL